jgi:hypothetical protein
MPSNKSLHRMLDHCLPALPLRSAIDESSVSDDSGEDQILRTLDWVS